MPLAVGDIVTVMLEDCRFYENQGQVKEIVNDEDPDGNIGVQFGRWCETLACTEEHAIIRFHESELRKDPDWTIEVKVFQCYGDNLWHNIYTLPEPFDPAQKCKAESCESINVRRCLINIWGSVYEIDLCEVCANAHHGTLGESFPCKAPAPVIV